MRRHWYTIGSAILASAAAAGVHAADQPQIITNGSVPAVGRDHLATCTRVDTTGAAPTLVLPGSGPAAAPAAVVSRGLALQPTYDHLAILQIAATSTLIDPYADLRRADMPAGGLDENHLLLKASRLALSRYDQAQPRVIVGGPDAGATAAQALPDPSFVRVPIPAPPAPGPSAPPKLQPLARK
jgi:hypothetical protein